MSKEHQEITVRVACPHCSSQFTAFIPLMGGKTEKQQCLNKTCGRFVQNRNWTIVSRYNEVSFNPKK